MIGRTLSHFQILRKLGQGGMGEVYLAKDTNLDREVAIKILPSDVSGDPKRLHRFVQEARMASAIKHANVAHIYEICETEGTQFIVMEYVEGEPLAEKIRGRPLETQAIRNIALQIASALDAAHSKGITHRDIKPANILVDVTGQVKVLDFGVAKGSSPPSAAVADFSTAIETQHNLLLGTVPYMSPEQALGYGIDHRSDIFSFGVVLYEMATGQRPFSGRTPVEIISRIAGASPVPISEVNEKVPRGLQHIIEKCLAKEVEQRYQTVRDLADELAAPEFTGGMPELRGRIPNNNLPLQVTSFIGREWEMAEVKHLLSKTRVLTLVGVGGIGKTRLALQVAADVLTDYPDGVWFVDLAPLADPALVPQTVASVLGVREEPKRPPIETLSDYLQPRRILLVLDNCEHLIGASAQITSSLIHSCPNLRVLATSRETLRIAGEAVFPVPSLSVTLSDSGSSAEDVLQSQACRLFIERAAAVQPAFTIDDRSARKLANVCYRLDGLPLAVELAAARIRFLSLEEINDRLEDRFRLLAAGPRTVLPRQQTLRAAIDWSYELLSDSERILFRRLAVFHGNCTLEAAEEVCAGDGIQKPDVMDLLAQLVEKSLVFRENLQGKTRYRLLETLLKYSEEKLAESGETGVMRRRHCAWALGVAEKAHSKLRGPEQRIWLDELELSKQNFRSALEWASENDRSAVLQLAAALGRFWYNHSHFREAKLWLTKILAQADSSDHWKQRTKVLYAATGLARTLGDYVLARSMGEESLSINTHLKDQHGVAASLVNLGMVLRHQGEYELAKSFTNQALDAFRELDETHGIANSLSELGHVAFAELDYTAAHARFDESLAISRQLGNIRQIAVDLNNIGDVYLALGEDSLAERHYKESLQAFSELGDKLGVADSLESLGQLAGKRKQPRRAVHLYSAAQTLRDSIGALLPLRWRSEHDQNISRLRDELSEAFSDAWTEGSKMSLEQGVAYALQDQHTA